MSKQSKDSRGGEIRVGIIGAGLIGQTHSMMLRKIADASLKISDATRKIADGSEGGVRVAAIADVSAPAAERLAARWPGARAYLSAEEIFRDDDIDAVWICTPTAMHLEACIGAAHAGKHVFCEKPLAMSAREATEIKSALDTAGVQSQVGLVLRFSPVYTVIRAMVQRQDAGRIVAITMRDDQDFPIRGAHPSAWRNDPKVTAGGTLVEHSVHDFDLLTWMFGAVKSVYCRTRNLNGGRGIEDFAATTLEFERGYHAQHSSIWHHVQNRPSNRRLEVFCENLFVATDFDAAGPIIVQRGADAREEIIPEREVMAQFSEIILAERPYLAPMKNYFAIPYALEDATFVAALGGGCAPYPALGDGVAAQRLVEAAYESARLGRPVDIATASNR